MQRVAVFCGSNPGKNPVYEKAAKALGDELSKRKLNLVYGAGSVGLMGIIADRMLANSSNVYGVIPQHLMDLEVGHTGLTELHVVATMHDRKMMMAELSDAFIAMPGGIGTLEEIIEVFTWNQLGIHTKPVAFLNVNGYYDVLFQFLEFGVNEKFIKQAHLDSLIIDSDPATLLDKIENMPLDYSPKWY